MASFESDGLNETSSETASIPTSELYTLLERIQWWIGLLELFVFFIGVPMNVAVLCLAHFTHKRALTSYVQQRTITEIFVVSMTSADLLFCSIHAPMMFLNFTLYIDLSTVPCLTLFAATHSSTVASSLSLLWLNINKFLHLHRPLHYVLYVNSTRAIACVVLCWIVSLSWGLFFILGPSITYDSECNIYLQHKSVYVIFTILFFLFPAIISLVISVYVAVVVVETKSNNDQMKFSRYSSTRFYGSYQKNKTDLLTVSPIKERPISNNFRVDSKQENPVVGSADKANFNWKRLPARSLPFPEGNYRNFNRRKAFSPSHWPPPETFISNSSSSRRLSHIRRISFVFTTTLWSTLTVLPYRVAFIVNNLPTPRHEDQAENDSSKNVAQFVYFCLFAIMALNAVGNPFITILTQRQYSVWFKQVWLKLTGHREDAQTRLHANGLIVNTCRGSIPTGETSEAEL